MKTKVIKLSLCQCGFPLFKDGVKLGDEYTVDLAMVQKGTITCGGCSMNIPTVAIWADGHGDTGWLPSEGFDL